MITSKLLLHRIGWEDGAASFLDQSRSNVKLSKTKAIPGYFRHSIGITLTNVADINETTTTREIILSKTKPLLFGDGLLICWWFGAQKLEGNSLNSDCSSLETSCHGSISANNPTKKSTWSVIISWACYTIYLLRINYRDSKSYLDNIENMRNYVTI